MQSPVHGKYNFSKSYYRNFYANRKMGLVNAGIAVRLMEEHMAHAPEWSIRNEKPTVDTLIYSDTNGNTHTDYTFNKNEYGTAESVVGAVDITNWLWKRTNEDETPKAGGGMSWICTMCARAGVLSKEELAVMVDYKNNVVLKRDRGLRQYIQYQKLGAIMDEKIQQDIFKHHVYKKLYTDWLVHAVRMLREGDYVGAEDTYYDAVRWVCGNYNVEVPNEFRYRPVL